MGQAEGLTEASGTKSGADDAWKGSETEAAIMNNLFPNMPKISKKKASVCDKHDFSLKPKNEYTLQPQYFHVSFCRRLQERDVQGTAESKECLNCPAFNRDGNYATPTFILSRQQGAEQLQGERMREQHQRRMINYTDQKSSLNVPKPRSKNNYCSVCRQNYTDYLEHIESPIHKKRIRSSDFNRHILELTQRFAQPQPPIIKVKHEPMDADGEQSVEIISNPHKKIKTNETLTFASTGARSDWLGVSPGYQAPPHRPIPTFSENLNNYNFNINMNMNMNMNLFLSGIPQHSMQYLSSGLPFTPPPFSPGYNPYMSMPYQSMMFQQMSHLSQMGMGLGGEKECRQVTYIVIDE